jgi:hypothetical protein
MQRTLVAIALVFGLAIAQNSILTYPGTVGILTGTGLATPWTNSLNQTLSCNAAFIQGSWFDSNTNTISAYNPLVITLGTKPAIIPTAPTVPATATVALWFGYNGNSVTLADTQNGGLLSAANCVNGLTGSIFLQFAYCNAVNFYSVAIPAVNNGVLKVPQLGTANDGGTCPTTRDFFVIDMDQSDNVVTTYLVTATQETAQGTLSNSNNLGANVVSVLTNASDCRLLSIAMDGALGCTPMQVTDLTETTVANTVATFATAELQANTWQQPPIALVPISHAMTRVNNQPSLQKTNAYRAGCGQTLATSATQADGTVYCQNLYFGGPKRLAANSMNFQNFPSPLANVATNLFAFLAQRMFTSFGPDGLNCASLLGVPNPIVPILNGNAVFVGATITVPNPSTTNSGLSTTNIIIIVVCTVVGSLLIVGLIAGIVWYRNRSMYS